MESKALVSNLAPIFGVSLLHNRLRNSDTRGGAAGFETLKFNAEMGTRGVKLVSVDRLQQPRVFKPIHFRKLSSEWEFDQEKWLANR